MEFFSKFTFVLFYSCFFSSPIKNIKLLINAVQQEYVVDIQVPAASLSI